jgi:hypothetical protein
MLKAIPQEKKIFVGRCSEQHPNYFCNKSSSYNQSKLKKSYMIR